MTPDMQRPRAQGRNTGDSHHNDLIPTVRETPADSETGGQR